MDRYQRVEKPKPEFPISENEIRITSQGIIRNYINYASSLLTEKCVKEIVFKAMGQAISKTVAITEILKKRIPNLHQHTSIGSISITDIWEPIEEGLVPVEQTRHISMISITLSTRELNNSASGAIVPMDGPLSGGGVLRRYQAPSMVEQPKRQNRYQQRQQPRLACAPENAANEDSYGQGRGHGRGRGRNWDRGGFGSYRGNYQGNHQGNYQGNRQGNYQDNGGYTNWSRGGGRGRGWGNHGTGYERGRGGRGYRRGSGRMGGRSWGGGY